MGMMIFIGGFVVVCIIHAATVNKDFESEKRRARKAARVLNIDSPDSLKLIDSSIVPSPETSDPVVFDSANVISAEVRTE